MTFFSESTIAAIATPRGTGGIAAIRISGPQSWEIAHRLSHTKKSWQAGRVYHDWLIDLADEKLVDEVIFLPFKAPHSYTGEDAVEIHCHGGHTLARLVLQLCLNQGAQPAEAGEFTRRALLNGRIDLTQAEAILDLIQAQGEALIKLSAHNMRHRTVGTLLEEYLQNITVIQADITASIDFPDEVDEPDRGYLAHRLRVLGQNIHDRVDISRRNQILREGIEVAIIGLPNAGKSSLFNSLLASERSIVTEIAGTTRDVIRETLSLKGVPITLTDTAGLRESADRVEIIGVERSWQAVEASEAIIYVLDGTQGLTPTDTEVLEKLEPKMGLIVVNKVDAPGYRGALLENPKGWPILVTSASAGSGIRQVLDWLETLPEIITETRDMDFLLSQRQIQHLETIEYDLVEAADTLDNLSLPLDLATVPLTHALLELQGLLGKDTTELVLDSVFSRFCVGK
jgi:tRNA modification GTPase